MTTWPMTKRNRNKSCKFDNSFTHNAFSTVLFFNLKRTQCNFNIFISALVWFWSTTISDDRRKSSLGGYDYDFQDTTSLYYRRLVMKFFGEIQHLQFRNETASWYSLFQKPKDRCSGNNPSKSFASWNSRNRILCKCLPGFQPNFPRKWYSGDFLGM